MVKGNDPKISVLEATEASYLRTFFNEQELNTLIKEKHGWYAWLVEVFKPLAVERVGPRTIGELIGVLARSDDNLNKRLQSRGIDLFSAQADRVRGLFGIKVLEDP